jgi:endonuclease/exonuclease/phosphatase family metal-dependent hydrolase
MTAPHGRNAWQRAFTGALAMALLAAGPGAQASPSTLSLATWNLEWLLSSETLRDLAQRCALGTARDPCDVAARLHRGTSDFAALSRYARELDADVVALQEVEGEAIASRVFSGYRFCFTARHDLQNVGFAIRRGIAFRCDADVIGISLGGRVRRGAQLTVFPGTPAELHLLSVHLKSGCSTGSLDAGKGACATLARQVQPLRAWVTEQARAGHAFALLGDFNRELAPSPGTGGTAGLDLLAGVASLHVAGADVPFRNCHAGQFFAAPIDHIVLGAALNVKQIPGSYRRFTYRAADAHRHLLPDHCPAIVRLQLS